MRDGGKEGRTGERTQGRKDRKTGGHEQESHKEGGKKEGHKEGRIRKSCGRK